MLQPPHRFTGKDRATPTRRSRYLAAAVAVLGLVIAVRLLLPQDAGLRPDSAWADARLPMPTAAGIPVALVEGGPDSYLPNRADERLRGVRIEARAPVTAPSGHATSTARVFFGNQSPARGIRDAYAYPVAVFMGEGCLRMGTDLPPHVEDGRRVYSHSWISYDMPAAAQALRRMDYLIDQADVIMCVGVNNGRNSHVPPMLASSYNAIAVGALRGNSSGGFTRFEGDGRCKPDLIASDRLTSHATPRVAAAAARLLESADAMIEEHPDAARAELIKALLMAGADKPRNWAPQEGRPLDEHMGAGMLNFEKSWIIQRSGPIAPGRVRQRYGWDFRAQPPGTPHHYRFTVAEHLGEASIMLVWHRRIDGRRLTDAMSNTTRWVDAPRLADFDLTLVRLDDDGRAEPVATSASKIDNVEHVYLPELPPGRYRLTVSRHDTFDEPWHFALAYRFESPAPPPVAEGDDEQEVEEVAEEAVEADATTDADAAAPPPPLEGE